MPTQIAYKDVTRTATLHTQPNNMIVCIMPMNCETPDTTSDPSPDAAPVNALSAIPTCTRTYMAISEPMSAIKLIITATKSTIFILKHLIYFVNGSFEKKFSCLFEISFLKHFISCLTIPQEGTN